MARLSEELLHTVRLLDAANLALAEKDREIARWKNTIRDEYVGFLAESKENLLQQYVNLTQMYGEQKHEIRRLLAVIAEKDREIEEIRALLGCHPAHIADTIRDLTSKTDQIPNIDRVRIAESNLRELREADHALMGQAVRFAERLSVFAQQYPEGDEACEFLASPKVRAWREHKEGTK